MQLLAPHRVTQLKNLDLSRFAIEPYVSVKKTITELIHEAKSVHIFRSRRSTLICTRTWSPTGSSSVFALASTCVVCCVASTCQCAFIPPHTLSAVGKRCLSCWSTGYCRFSISSAFSVGWRAHECAWLWTLHTDSIRNRLRYSTRV